MWMNEISMDEGDKYKEIYSGGGSLGQGVAMAPPPLPHNF